MRKAVPGSTVGFTGHSATAGSVSDSVITTERALAAVLAELLDRDQVFADEHFFDDLGADSMMMARFCARLRTRPDLPSISMKDVYQHPTTAALTRTFAPPSAPASPIEAALTEALAELLSRDQVSADEHFFDELGADSMVMARFCARIRKRNDLPSVAMKDIYEYPTVRGLATALAGPPEPSVEAASPAPSVEVEFAKVLGEVVGVDKVPVDSNFFDDLGSDSMVMARFCARIRKRDDLPPVAMKDVYDHPTVRSLAAAAVESASSPARPSAEPSPVVAEAPERASTREYVLCGLVQLSFVIAFSYLAAFVGITGFEWVSTGSGPVEMYLRAVLLTTAVFLGTCLLPIGAKWLLIGRWRPQRIRIWSVAYVRFWVVKTLVRVNPLVLFVGSPLYPLYLRALGAKVGRGVAIFSRHVPVCTDLLAIGDGSVIRKDSFFNCYRARAGTIEVGAVTLGKDVLVGEATVLDIGTSLGDASQLGHASSLHNGQAVPAGECWHGTPAQRAEVDYRAVGPTRCSAARKVVYSTLQLLGALFGYLPLGFFGITLLLIEVPFLAALLGPDPLAFTSWTFYWHALVGAVVVSLGILLGGLLLVVTLPRLFAMAVKPGRTYPLYGFHYWCHRAIARMTNLRFFTYLFGDSSYIVHFLRCLGYDLSHVQQTGSNFGLDVKHENPYLSSVGRGTMVADGLSIMNADYSSTSFRVARTSIGARNFLGNYIAYPAAGRTGDNCLLATKVMVPIDGEVREDVGLLGSPSFEIPRSVQRDKTFDHLGRGDEFRRRLRAKNKHNAVTMALFLLVRWCYLLGVILFGLAVVELHHHLGELALAAALALAIPLSVLYFALVERVGGNFRVLRPQNCSIYEPYFWWHERYWKLSTQPMLLNGTAFKGLVWRILGVRIGRRVFDDGCTIMEKTMVSLGDDCALNEGSIIQCHSQEDGAFKSDTIAIDSGCTVGVYALVHYGVRMGDGVVLAPDSFLMKGEEVPPRAEWGGNPAGELQVRRSPQLEPV